MHTKRINTDENLRLPTDLLPSIYNIQLLPLIEDGRTDGEVDMLIDCVRSTRNISFHSANTTIQESSVKVIFSYHRPFPIQKTYVRTLQY